MSDREMYLGAMAGSYEGELPPPNTRSLKWMAKILGADIVTEPVQSAEEAYLQAIYENGGGGSSVTVEPLTVTENGTYTAEEGTAYSPVAVAVPGITKLTTTYTAATDVVSQVSFPLPSSNLPKLIFIKSDTPATELSDYALGEIIQIVALPVPDDEISISNSCNSASSSRNKSSGKMSVYAFTQIISGSSAESGNYSIDLENRILTVKVSNNFLAPAGVTYNIECYY